jgi:hypothetical protein
LLKSIKPSGSVEDVSKNMLLNNCGILGSAAETLEFIQKVWRADFFDNIERSAKEGWDFYYFFPEVGIDNTFLIAANMYYPPNESEKNVLYNLVVVKTDGKSFFIWDMNE